MLKSNVVSPRKRGEERVHVGGRVGGVRRNRKSHTQPWTGGTDGVTFSVHMSRTVSMLRTVSRRVVDPETPTYGM